MLGAQMGKRRADVVREVVMSVFESPEVPPDTTDEPNAAGRRLSYKFQRLRERIRQAIETGELAGKLPGERVLARRFKVNAKTLSKALTDLAAEGLLERNIGLGTFVRGADAAQQGTHKVLMLRDHDDHPCPVTPLLESESLEVQEHRDLDDLPPSLLQPYRSVIVWSARLTEQVLRDLVVRNKNVLLIDRQLPQYTTHAVMINRPVAAVDLARRLVREGHTRLMIIDPHGPGEISQTVASAIACDGVSVKQGALDDIPNVVLQNGVTAFICSSSETARHAMDLCRNSSIRVPAQVSVTAVGRKPAEPVCSGQYVTDAAMAEAISQLLRDATPHRPLSLWLSGEFVDVGTIAPAPSAARN